MPLDYIDPNPSPPLRRLNSDNSLQFMWYRFMTMTVQVNEMLKKTDESRMYLFLICCGVYAALLLFLIDRFVRCLVFCCGRCRCCDAPSDQESTKSIPVDGQDTDSYIRSADYRRHQLKLMRNSSSSRRQSAIGQRANSIRSPSVQFCASVPDGLVNVNQSVNKTMRSSLDRANELNETTDTLVLSETVDDGLCLTDCSREAAIVTTNHDQSTADDRRYSMANQLESPADSLSGNRPRPRSRSATKRRSSGSTPTSVGGSHNGKFPKNIQLPRIPNVTVTEDVVKDNFSMDNLSATVDVDDLEK